MVLMGIIIRPEELNSVIRELGVTSMLFIMTVPEPELLSANSKSRIVSAVTYLLIDERPVTVMVDKHTRSELNLNCRVIVFNVQGAVDDCDNEARVIEGFLTKNAHAFP